MGRENRAVALATTAQREQGRLDQRGVVQRARVRFLAVRWFRSSRKISVTEGVNGWRPIVSSVVFKGEYRGFGEQPLLNFLGAGRGGSAGVPSIKPQ